MSRSAAVSGTHGSWPLRLARVALGVAMLMQGLVFTPAEVAVAAPLATAVPLNQHDTTMWVATDDVDGIANVYTMEYALDGTLYLGGDFTHMGPPTGGFGSISANGTMQGEYPHVDGYVYASIADGAGGYYIGGNFRAVGGVARANLAHILSDGSLDAAWNPGANGTVRAFALDGTYLYAGGDFTEAGGLAFARLTRINRATGAVPAGFSPSPDDTVRALAVVGSTLYVGGSFSTLGGASRDYLGAVNTSGVPGVIGQATSWNPDPNDTVYALAADATYLFAGGDFTLVGAESLSRVARFTIAGGAVSTTWNPVVNDLVRTIAITDPYDDSSNMVLIGGDFTDVDGTAYDCAAALYYNSGSTAGLWSQSQDGNVFSITADANWVYVGGSGVNVRVGGLKRYSNDQNLMLDDMWKPLPLGGPVRCVTPSGTNLGVGGEIHSVGAHRRNRIAALDDAGALKAWYPTGGASGTVRAIKATGNGHLYVGGEFTTIGTIARNRIAELNPSTAAVLAFNPGADGTVYAIDSPDGSVIYVGGDFGTIGNPVQTRARIAALNSAGACTAWYAGSGANDTVKVLDLNADNSAVYVGGEFTGIFNVARNSLALLQTAAPGVATWDPNVTGGTPTTVNDLQLTSTYVYFGGSFSTVGTTARANAAAVSVATGEVSASWAPQPNGRVLAIEKSTGADALVIGGEFTQVSGASRWYAAAVRPVGSATLLTSWHPHLSSWVQCIAADDTSVTLGGNWHSLHLDTAPNVSWRAPTRFLFDEAAPSGTISINGGAASTSSTNVTITIAVTDDSAIVTQQFAPSAGGPWSASEPLGTTKAYPLTPGDGTKTVYAKFTDESGNTRTVSDPIVLSTAAPVTLQPVYRFYNVTNGTHFFTPSAAERDTVMARWSNVYTFEGPVYYTNPANNTTPLTRLYNRASGSHFYTASAGEAAEALAKWPTVFQLDGLTYAVNPGRVANSIAVYRFFNVTNGSHFYTASESEKNAVIATWPHIYSYEGPAFWLGQ